MQDSAKKERVERVDVLHYLKLLGDNTRFRIISLLLSGEKCVCEIMDNLKLSQSLISHHLHHLKAAGLIRDRREGVWIYYSIDQRNMEEYKVELFRWLNRSLNQDLIRNVDPCKDYTKGFN